MALPTSRNMSHPSGTVLKGTTVDAIQDAIIGRKHPDRAITIHPNAWINHTGDAGFGDDDTVLGGTGFLQFPLELDVGDRIRSVTIARFGVVTADRDMRIKLRKSLASGGGSFVFDVADDNVPFSWGELTITASLPVTVAAGEAFSLWIVPISNPNSMKIGPSRVVVDRP